MDLDRTLCYCHHVTKRKVVNFVRQRRPKRASQISECFEAGSGCGWCIPFLVKIHREVLAGRGVSDEELSPEEYEARRGRYIESVRAGDAERNRYEGPAPGPRAPVPGEAEGAPSESPGAPPQAGAGFDYTRYFSRSRPDPEPEDLG